MVIWFDWAVQLKASVTVTKYEPLVAVVMQLSFAPVFQPKDVKLVLVAHSDADVPSQREVALVETDTCG